MDVEIPLLSDEGRQNLEIVLDALEATVKAAEDHLAHLRQLRFSILNTALSPSAVAEAAAEVPA